MSVGFFAFSGFQLKRVGNTYEHKHKLTDFNAKNKNVSSYALLSGIKTSARTISNININSFNIDTQTGIATLNIDISIDSSLEVLFFSYIWWINSPQLKFNNFYSGGASSLVYEYRGTSRVVNNQHSFLGLEFIAKK